MNYLKIYTNFLKRFIKIKHPLRIVFDCSNGAAGLVLQELLKTKNHKLKTKFINAKPDGNFQAHGPDPWAKGAMEQLRREVKKQRADLGIIFDADGDRVFFIDDKGRLIDSNEIAYFLMQMFKPPFIVGVNLGWRVKNNKGVGISRVGHYFIKKMMWKKKANFGAELSGHYYFSALGGYWDSGIFAAIQMINFVSGLKEKISEHLENLHPKYYRSGEINAVVRDKGEAMRILKKVDSFYKKQANEILKVDGLSMEFGMNLFEGFSEKSWWFNLRPSNTENLLRLNAEAESKRVLEEKLKEIKRFLAVSH